MEIRKAAKAYIKEMRNKYHISLQLFRKIQSRYTFCWNRLQMARDMTEGDSFQSEENKDLRNKMYDAYCAAEQPMLKLKQDLERYKIWCGNHIYMNRHGYTDMHPYEVIRIDTPKKMIIREMLAVETEESKKRRKETFVPTGFLGVTDNDVQEWDIRSQDTSDFDFAVRLHGDGYWYDANGGRYSMSDKPIKFYDFNF